ncbi:MAG: glycosyltransferase [Actinomycetota bacterium]
MQVLGFGTYELAAHPRVGTILDGLRALGDDVTEINESLGFTTAERVATLVAPWFAYRFVLRLLARWAMLTQRALRARRGRQFDAIIVGYLGHFDVVLARVLFPRSRIVLDQLIFAGDTARDRGVTGGMRLRLLDWLDRLAVRCADAVLLDTDENVELLADSARDKAIVVPVGASASWFAAGESAVAGTPGKLRVAFFGLYTPLQGATIIGDALALLADRPEISATMIGTGQQYDDTRAAAAANDSITWLDWVDADDLPQIIAAHDVCLGIFGSTPKAMRVVPNKVFQGAAAGCVVVTSDTPPQRRMLDRGAVFVPPGDPGALADALRSLAGDETGRLQLRADARSIAVERFTAVSVVRPVRERLFGQ